MAGTSRYEVRVTPEAVRQLRRLDATQRSRVDRALIAVLDRRDLERWLRGR